MPSEYKETKIKLISHTFDNVRKLTPFTIRYVLYYLLKGLISSSECNLFDVDLIKPSSYKHSFGCTYGAMYCVSDRCRH